MVFLAMIAVSTLCQIYQLFIFSLGRLLCSRRQHRLLRRTGKATALQDLQCTELLCSLLVTLRQVRILCR